nr:hypothetical protein [Tanacetum cinerariifolium]
MLANAELRKSWNKIKGKSVDTNFGKPSILGKPPLQQIRNQPVESIGSNDMVHNYYLEEAKKKAKIQKDKAFNTKPSVQNSARLPNTTNSSKQKPQNSNQQPRNWLPSMSSRVSNRAAPPRSGLRDRIFTYVGLRKKMGDADNNTLTMEQYLALTRGTQAPGMVKPKIRGNVNFEIKSQFMRELREDTFSKNKNDDAYEHVERVLDIVNLFNILGVTHDAIMLRVFPITLTRATKRRVSNDSLAGIVAITNKLDSLRGDIKKLKENVHAIQVGCKNYRGAHLNKECPLHEEVKSVKEVKYGEFGRPFPNNDRNHARYRVGNLSEMMILGRPFLATIYAQINVFQGEISLGIGEGWEIFDMNGIAHHSTTHIEKVYMINKIHKEESFNLLKIGEYLFSYEHKVAHDFQDRSPCHVTPVMQSNTQGNPILLDLFTSSMCNDPWGRIGFASALIKIVKPTIVATEEVNKDGFTTVINKRKNGTKQTNPNPNKLGEIKLNVPKKFEYRRVFGTKPTVGENDSDVIKTKNHFVVFSEHENLVKQLEEGELSGRSTNDAVLSTHDDNRDSDSEVEETIIMETRKPKGASTPSNLPSEHRYLWSELKLHKNVVCGYPWILMGDFNVALNLEDYLSSSSCLNSAMNDFKACVNKIEVVDINSTGAYGIFQPYRLSNHSFASVNVEGYHMYRVVTKMKALKKPLRKLLHSHGILHDRVKALRNEVDEIQKALDCNPLDNNLCKEEAAYVSSFIDAKLDEEYFLKKKAKIEWDAADVEVTGPLVADCFVTHYQQFLGTNMECDELDIEGLFLKHISNDTSFNMVRNVSNEEIKTAMFGIGDDRARDQMEINHTFLSLIPKVSTPLKETGLRQGDLISPYIFMLFMELVNISFADDLLIFTRGDVDSARLIMESLDEFQKSSGLVTSVPKRELPVKYLRVPLISSRLLNRDCKVFVVLGIRRISLYHIRVNFSCVGFGANSSKYRKLSSRSFGANLEMDGESLESYYSRFYKMMNELIRNQCKVTNHQVNIQFLLQLQLEWQRFVTLVKQSQELKTVSYHKLYDILKQHQHEVNEIRAERIARVANPLALVAQQQPNYHPQTHPTHYTQFSSTKSQQAATMNRGKVIVNSPQPIYDQEPSMVAEDDETSKDKEIDKLIALISLSFNKIYKPTNNNLQTSSNTSRANQDNSPRINRSVGYENQRIGNIAGARETVGSTAVQKFRIQCYNCKEFGHVARECQKPKRAKDVAYHKEKMLLCKQEEAGIQLNAEQAGWRDDTNNDELEDQELEAHYMYMAQLQEVSPDAAASGPIFDAKPLQKISNDDHYNVFAIESARPEQSKSVHDTYPIEQDAQNVIIDSLDMSNNRVEIDQNDDDNDLAKERELLASLIEKLKCEIDESKNRNKILETSNMVIIENLKGEIEDFKNKNKNKNKSLESSNNYFKEANNRLSETNNLLYTDYKKSEVELVRRNSREYASQMEFECAKVRGDFLSYKMEYQKSCTKYTQTINDLNQTISEMKDKLSARQETISILSQQKEAQIKLYKTQEDNELDKVIELENKVKVLDNIVYKTGQSVQTMNMLNNKCQTSFAKHEFLKKAQRVNPRLYDIGCYNDNLALMLAPDSNEVIRLEKESQSKLSDLIRPFDYNKLNNLYDLFVPQREKSSEQRYFSERSRLSHTYANNGNSKESFSKQTTLLEKLMDESISLDKKCQSSIEIFKVKTYVNTFINGVKLCKEKIANKTYFGYIDPFIQNTIEANFSPVISRINAGLEQFHMCLNEEMVADLRYFNSLELETLPPNKKSILKNTNMLAPGMYKLYTDHNQARTYQLPQDSRKTNKRVSFSTGVIPTTSVSRPQLKSNPMGDRVMCNNSQGKKQEVEDQRKSVKLSKNKTSVTACNDNLNAKTLNVNSVCATCDKCVLNDKHDICVLNSVAKPIKKTVASESNQKPRNITRKLYERVSKTCSWWYPKFTPSRYKWKPKSGQENVNPNVSMPLGNASRNANVMDPMTSRRSTVSYTPLSSNSFAARRDFPIYRRLWVLKAHDGKSQASN